MIDSGVEEAIEAIRAGKMVVVVDDEDRENEGDLTMAAQEVTPEAINFMAQHARGLICLPMSPERLDELEIPLMVEENTSAHRTAFCVSIEAARDVTTGISAHDRAATIRWAIDPESKPEDLRRPGHMFPLRAQQGGVLKRAGHTEAAVDLARIAGFKPAGVICEILNPDGTMARLPELQAFARAHDLLIISVEELIKYRMKNESFVQRVASVRLPTEYGEFTLIGFENDLDHKSHLVLQMGTCGPDEEIMVRVHSQCLTGDVFGSRRCDCGPQLARAMRLIAQEGQGVILYLRQEGRGIGLMNKLRAYELQDHGKDTVEANETLGFRADQRDYGIGAQILNNLGLRKIRVLTNNPKKFVGLKGFNLEIVDRIPLEVDPSTENEGYLKVKKEKLGHLLQSV